MTTSGTKDGMYGFYFFVVLSAIALAWALVRAI